MYEQINNQFLATSKQLAETTFKAHGLAFAGLERVVSVQMQALQDQMNATANFWSHASDVREIDGARALLPTGAQLVRESAEKAYATAQEVMNITAQTGESIGALVRDTMETANQNVIRATEQVVTEAGNATREAVRSSDRFVKEATTASKKAR